MLDVSMLDWDKGVIWVVVNWTLDVVDGTMVELVGIHSQKVATN